MSAFCDTTGLDEYCVTDNQRNVLAEVRSCGTVAAAAKSMGVSERVTYCTLRRIKVEAARRGWSPDHDMTKVVPEGFGVKGVSSYYDADGQLRAQWVKSQKEIDDDQQTVEDALKERFARVKPLRKIAAPRKKLNKDLMTAYMLSDAHLGLYAWGEESGEDWNLDIASRMIVGAVKYLVDCAPACDEGLIANLGDFSHTDNFAAQTPKGQKPQDVNARWPEIVAVGVDAFVSCIDLALEKHRRVRVISTPGNHDMHTGVMMNIALQQAYKKNPRVIFDNSPSVYHYLLFGKVLIGVTHGDRRVKPNELPLVMATDRPDDWGTSKHRYWWTGHLHHQRKFEPKGGDCTVETFRTMSAKDGWHAGQGYRAGREMQSILLHREWGEVGRQRVTPDMLRPIV